MLVWFGLDDWHWLGLAWLGLAWILDGSCLYYYYVDKFTVALSLISMHFFLFAPSSYVLFLSISSQRPQCATSAATKAERSPRVAE